MGDFIRGLKQFPCRTCKYNLTQRVGAWSCDNKKCDKYSIPYTQEQLIKLQASE